MHSFHRQSFLYAPSLHILDISNNILNSFLSDELAMLESIALRNIIEREIFKYILDLFVSYNLITAVENFDRRTFPSLMEADFSGNPFRCDCDLKPFINFLAFSGGVRFRRLHAYSSKLIAAVINKLNI